MPAKQAVDPQRLVRFEIAFRVALVILAFALPPILTTDVHVYWLRLHEVDLHHLPYRDVSWEYPPLTLLPMVAMLVALGNNVAFHLLFVPLMVACEYGTLVLLRRYDIANFRPITVFWCAAVLPISTLAWFRLDYFAMLLATVALLAMLQNKPTSKWVVAGYLTKLWTVLFVVPLFAQRRYAEVAKIAVAIVVTTGLWYAFSPHGFHEFLAFRKGSGFQIESIPGSLLELGGRSLNFTYGAFNVDDHGWTIVQKLMPALNVLGIVAIAGVAWLRKERDDVLITAAVVGLTLCCSRLVSAQFLTWLAPFIALRVVSNRRLAITYTVMMAMTWFMVLLYRPLVQGNIWVQLLLAARNVVLIGFVIAMIVTAFRPAREHQVAL